MTLKDLRIKYHLSQAETASFLGISLRTLRRYEKNDEYGDNIKRQALIKTLEEHYEINEEKGLLSVETIKDAVTKVFDNEYKGMVDFCFLFGSYAKGCAKEDSDLDIYVSTTLNGLKFVGLAERLRETLHKRIDVIRSSELANNIELTNEIMRDGIKIYWK